MIQTFNDLTDMKLEKLLPGIVEVGEDAGFLTAKGDVYKRQGVKRVGTKKKAQETPPTTEKPSGGEPDEKPSTDPED